MDKPETHWIPYDAPKVHRTLRRAICGTLTDHHNNQPTCRACLEYLIRTEQESVEDRYGQ